MPSPDLKPLRLLRAHPSDRGVHACSRCGARVLFGDRDGRGLVLLAKSAVRFDVDSVSGSCRGCGAEFSIPRADFFAGR
jgi:hypothetical protein